MNIRYRVDLSDIERTHLTALLNGGKHAARKIKRAQILLAADAGVSDDMIAGRRLVIRLGISRLSGVLASGARRPARADS